MFVMICEFGVQFVCEGVWVNVFLFGLVVMLLFMELFVKDVEWVQCCFVYVLMGWFVELVEIVVVVVFFVSDDLFFMMVSNFFVDGGISGVYVMLL